MIHYNLKFLNIYAHYLFSLFLLTFLLFYIFNPSLLIWLTRVNLRIINLNFFIHSKLFRYIINIIALMIHYNLKFLNISAHYLFSLFLLTFLLFYIFNPSLLIWLARVNHFSMFKDFVAKRKYNFHFIYCSYNEFF